MPKKRFIDRKHSITFVLGSRDQKDPLIADETAPQHVLIPVVNEKRKEEQKKFGIYFDDDYNYLKHLKSAKDEISWDEVKKKAAATKRKAETKPAEEPKGTKSMLMLPSSVFQSEVREKIGMLNKAAPLKGPQLDWDSELVEAMEEDFDFENPDNQIADDFIKRAGGLASDNDDSDDDEYSDCSSDFDVDDADLEGKLPGILEQFGEDGDMATFMDRKWETKSRFTEYSVSSSVMRRNAGLTLVDEQFEKLFEEYDVDKGDLFDPCDMDAKAEYDELLSEGFKASKILEMIENDASNIFSGKRARVHLDQVDDDDVKTYVKNYDHTAKEDMEVKVIEEPTEQWDCQSIISTYSNTYNRPKVLMPPRKKLKEIEPAIVVSEKTGFPKGVLGANKLTAKNLAKLGDGEEVREEKSAYAHSIGTGMSMPLSVRTKHEKEVPEDKKQRKTCLKSYQKERRVEKKMNKLACQVEKESQKHVMLNLRQNLQGIKIV